MKKIICVCFLIIALGTTSSVQGGTKEEIVRLQSDVLALQTQIRNLDKTFTDQMGSLKSLVGQLNDQIGKSNVILARISTTLENQADNSKTANQGVLQEVRNLAHKIDDTGTRVSALAQQISEIKVQSTEIPQRRSLGTGPDASPDDIYHEAYNDLVQGNYDLAIQGFNSFVTTYPRSEKSDDALYYLGETYYNDNKFPLAISAFTRVLSDYPTGDKVASALYKRALAELRIQEKNTARDDFRAVIQRFPTSPEAGLARTQLEALGGDPVKPKVGPVRPKRLPLVHEVGATGRSPAPSIQN